MEENDLIWRSSTIAKCWNELSGIGQDETGLVSERRLRVGLVTEPTGLEDPYIHGAYLGLERAVRELGIRGRALTPAPKEGCVPSLSLLARQKYDLIIGVGFFAAAAVDRVATEFGLVSERRLRVGLVTEPTGLEDPYIHGAYLGLERAVRELGIRGRALTPAPKEGCVPSLSL